jgi:hypothetical protein
MQRVILVLMVLFPLMGAAQDRERPMIEGSMIGYIENAIVGSQFRLRFDAAYNNTFPDRAEFFYPKCSCYQNLAGAPAFDPDASGPGRGIPESLDFQQLYFNVEYAPASRFSIFTEFPVRWLQPQSFLLSDPPFNAFGNQSGLGDIRAGAKLAMLASPDHYLTFQFRAFAASGDGSQGLGTDHTSLEPALLYFQRLSDRAAIESQIGTSYALGGNNGVPTAASEDFSGSVFFYGIGPSFELVSSESIRFAPVVELIGWRVLSGFQTDLGGPVEGVATEAEGINIVNIKLGARTAIGNHNSFYVGYGRALTDADWYEQIVRFEYRYAF